MSWFLPALVFLVPVLIYFQGLPGDFEFDDGINIVKNEYVRIKNLDYQNLKNAALSSNSGPLRRPVVMLSFALNYYFAQESASSYKAVNIVIHAINALLLYCLTLLVLRRFPAYQPASRLYAFFVAVIWALLPINLTSVLYVIQRMVSLGGTFALLAVLSWYIGRRHVEDKGRIPMWWMFLFVLNLLLAVLCKETYVLTGLAVMLLDWVLFRRRNAMEKVLMSMQVLLLLMALAGIAWLLISKPEVVVGDFSQRQFSMAERIMTQCRVIVFYISLMLFPSNLRLGLYHDDFEISHSLSDPVTTLWSVLFLAAMVVYVIRHQRDNKLLFLGVAWYFCWHLIESTVVSLELVHEHRNYLASIGFVWTGLCAFRGLKAVVESKAILNLVLAAVLLANAGITSVRAKEWSDLVDHALAEVNHHPSSVRAAYQLGRIHLLAYYGSHEKIQLVQAYRAFSNAAQLSDYDLLPWFGMIRVGLLLGENVDRPVRQLVAKLETSKIPVSTTVALSDFQECIKAKECNGLEVYYLLLLDALLRNPNLDQKSLSQLYSLKASYHSEVLNSYEQAYVVLKQGVAVFPKDYNLRKSVLYYHVITADLEKAKNELEGFRFDFGEMMDAKRVIQEVCDIFAARGFEYRCLSSGEKQENVNAKDG